jgi:hypothetical protein
MIAPFFVNEFGYYLEDLVEPLRFVLKFFILNIEDNRLPSQGLIDQCGGVLAQYHEIALEKAIEQMGIINMPRKEFSEAEVFANVNEFFAF